MSLKVKEYKHEIELEKLKIKQYKEYIKQSQENIEYYQKQVEKWEAISKSDYNIFNMNFSQQ